MELGLKAAITGVAGFLPEDKLTNQDLEKMVETTDDWIFSRTGIKERRILKKGLGLSHMGEHCVKELLRKTNTNAEDIDLIICATITGDMVFPDSANQIAYKVGAVNAYGFDLSAACSGFLYGLQTGSKFIQSGTHKKVIVVGGDVMSSIIDYTDRTTCVIFGDGLGAVLLEPSQNGYGIVDSAMYADGSGIEFLNAKAGGSINPTSLETVQNKEHLVFQNGGPVFKRAVQGMSSSVKEVMDRNQLTNADITWLVPHQANMRIISTVASMLDFPLDRVMQNIEKYGNTTAGTLPLCLTDYEHVLKKGDKVILTAFGGGFTWGALYLEWAYDSQK
jgi:3-oxoacyl-[acyl-carrier-protein] synthase III